MSAWVHRVLLSAVGSLLLTDSVIVNSLLEHDSESKDLVLRRVYLIEQVPSDVFLFTKM